MKLLLVRAELAILVGLLASAGCYSDLDFNHIECDVNAPGGCPGGYVCSAGLCAKAPAVVDAAPVEDAAAGPLDEASVDLGMPVDLAAGEVLSPADRPAPIDGAPDGAVDRSDDIPTVVDASDAPQSSVEAGLLDTASPTGADAVGVEGGGDDAGKVDAGWHPIDEFPITTKNSNPCSLTVGADNNLWFCECDGNNIGRMNVLGDVKEYPLAVPCFGGGIVMGSDNNIWFPTQDAGSGGSAMGRLVPSTGDVKAFSSDYCFSYVILGLDGNVWFTCGHGAAQIGKVTPAGVITSDYAQESTGGLAIGPDKYLYFGGGNFIFRVDADGSFNKVFTFPTINNRGLIGAMTVGSDARFWYTYQDGSHSNMIGAMAMTGTPSNYVVSQGDAWPSSIAKGSDGNIWITDADGIVRVTPSGDVAVFQLPTLISSADSIVAGPDGNLWFVDKGTNKIGRIRP